MAQQFNSYRLYYYTAPQYNWDVLVDLYNDSTWVGRLLFMKEGQSAENPLSAAFALSASLPADSKGLRNTTTNSAPKIGARQRAIIVIHKILDRRIFMLGYT